VLDPINPLKAQQAGRPGAAWWTAAAPRPDLAWWSTGVRWRTFVGLQEFAKWAACG